MSGPGVESGPDVVSGPPSDSRHAEYLAHRAAVLRPVPGGLAGGEGELVVLLPGFGGALDEFAFLAPMLARRRRVLALELPEAPFDVLVERVRAALPTEPFTLVGFSFGALLALAVAEGSRAPRALVLGAGWLDPGAALSRFAELWLRLRSSDSGALPALARLALLGAGSSDEAGLPDTPATVAHLQAALTVDLSAHAVAAPTMVLAGEHDALVSREHSERLFGSFEDARLAVLDAGHALLAERPAEVLALVESFLADTAHPLVRVAG